MANYSEKIIIEFGNLVYVNELHSAQVYVCISGTHPQKPVLNYGICKKNNKIYKKTKTKLF